MLVSMPFSAAIFCAEGMTAGDAGAAAGFAFSSFTSSFFETTSEDFPSVSMVAITSPATTVLLSPFLTLTSTPSAGAGNSSTTLSVSMSIRFSSRFTASPCFLCQASSVASETDSESCGTLTSISIFFLFPSLSAQALHRQHEIVRQRREGRIYQLLLLLVVQRQVTGRGRGRGLAHGVAQDLLRAHVAQHVVLQPVPGALVARFFLAPDDLVGVRIEVDLRLKLVVRERIELRDAHDGDVLRVLLLARRHQVEEHLPAAQDDALHLVRPEALVPVAVDRAELALGELGQRRHRLLVAQQALGREDDERLAVGADHLPAQQEEHLHRRGRDADLDVVVGAQLQEALWPAG